MATALLATAVFAVLASLAADAGYHWLAWAVALTPGAVILFVGLSGIYERWKYGNQPPPWAEPLFREGARD